ncbi:MAG: mechanosensitive ion channel [Oscillatoria sp. SIO1A7]|nr:mechanosensitive ion channel [Oscillatoria sp. SIO1A7]
MPRSRPTESRPTESRPTESPLNLKYRLKYRFHIAAIAGMTCFSFVAWIPPVLSQEFQGQGFQAPTLQLPNFQGQELQGQEFQSEAVEREEINDKAADNTAIIPASDSSTAVLAEPISTKDIEIPVDELKLLLKPLTLAELEIEAAAWLQLLKAKVREISDAEIAIKRKNRQFKKEEEVVKALEKAKKKLEEAEELQKNATEGSSEYEEASQKVEEAKEALEKAQAAVQEASKVKEKIEEDESIKKAVEAAKDRKDEAEDKKDEAKETNNETEDKDEAEDRKDEAEDRKEREIEKEEKEEEDSEGVSKEDGDRDKPDATEEAAEEIEEAAAELKEGEGSDRAPSAEIVTEKKEDLEEAAEKLQDKAEEDSKVKTQLVVNVTELQQEQTAIVDRFKTVLEELNKKGGQSELYHKYIQAISGIEIDVTDTKSMGVRLIGWLESEEGGLRWAGNIIKFLGIVIVSIIISQMMSASIDYAIQRVGETSAILRHFLIRLVKRGGIVVGILLGLTALEVSLGPVFALLGGASFVLAFALQSNLGNLASGLMIMFYKPFDVGHRVEVNGISGKVQSINLASTKIRTFDRKLVTIPNNKVWGDNIINKTATGIRGAILPIRVSMKQNTDWVEEILMAIAKSHELVLEKPKTRTFITEYGEYYIELGLLFYAPEDDYWPVRGDLMRSIKERLEQEGIFLAMPTQNILIKSSLDNEEDIINGIQAGISTVSDSSLSKETEIASSVSEE